MARFVLLCSLAFGAALGCGDGSSATGTSTGSGAGPVGGAGGVAMGGGGSGGSQLCDGPDILVTSDVLDDPSAWQTFPSELGASNFWLADDAIGLVWLLPSSESFAPVYMLVTYFDRLTAQPIETLQRAPFPPELTGGGITLESVAGNPEGDYAALTLHSDDTLPGQVAQMVVTGSRDGSVFNAWPTPWNRLEATVQHIGWDGEAFTMLSRNVGELTLRMVRLSVDGTVVTGPMNVGTATTVQEGRIAFHTDADTGITWVVSSMEGAVWLTGSHRDGSLVAGMDPAAGGLMVEPIDVSASGWAASHPHVATDGADVVVSWREGGFKRTLFQRIMEGAASASTVVLPDAPTKAGAPHVVLPNNGSWWVGDYVSMEGIATHRLEDAELNPLGLLIDHDACEPTVTCVSPDHSPVLDARNIQAEGRDDDRWFGYLDRSSCFETPDKPYFCPYRIVKVLEGCSYPTAFGLGEG